MTDRQTDHATPCVGMGRIYVRSTVMRPNRSATRYHDNVTSLANTEDQQRYDGNVLFVEKQRCRRRLRGQQLTSSVYRQPTGRLHMRRVVSL